MPLPLKSTADLETLLVERSQALGITPVEYLAVLMAELRKHPTAPMPGYQKINHLVEHNNFVLP